MEPFKLYLVWTTEIKSGKGGEAAKWWNEKGKAAYASLPGVKSVKAYGVQFGLGGNFIELWLELENYAALDRMDEDLYANPQKYAAFGDITDLLKNSSARILGDWPESHWSPTEE